MNQFPISREEATHGIVEAILLTIFTCGIYGLIWKFKLFKTVNAWLGRNEYEFWLYFFLSLITCGIYAVYIEYKFCISMMEIQRANGYQVTENFGILGIILSLTGLGIVLSAIQQHEINKWYNQEQPSQPQALTSM